MTKRRGIVLTILLASSICNAQTGVDELLRRARESGDALIRGDFNKLVDLTYPKLVELIGGRARMVSLLKTRRKEMKTQGNEFSSVSVHQPKETVSIGTRTFAIVPFTLKLNVPEGTLIHETFLIGISEDRGVTWTLIDGTNLDERRLRILLPDAGGKIILPERQPPLFQRNP